MAHFSNDLFNRNFSLYVEFQHCYKRMLNQGSSGGSFKIGIPFFLDRMRGMVGSYYVEFVIKETI